MCRLPCRALQPNKLHNSSPQQHTIPHPLSSYRMRNLMRNATGAVLTSRRATLSPRHPAVHSSNPPARAPPDLRPPPSALRPPVPSNTTRLLNDREDVERLSQLGVLFLLFEMGLELSLDRLKSLAKFAFGMGSLQVRIDPTCSPLHLEHRAIFTAPALNQHQPRRPRCRLLQ